MLFRSTLEYNSLQISAFMTKSITIPGGKVAVISHENEDFVCLTDIAKRVGGDGSQVETWLRNKNTLEFLGVWETINNPQFNSHEFVGIRNEAGTNRFNLSAKTWIKEWRTQNSNRGGNLRDYLSVEQLLVLANIESYNPNRPRYVGKGSTN